ncbi:hypothetical protein NX779_02760 [Mycoplasma cottewii]|uniref:Uncharacterized protein n=1 Tax=Mycoplasma cottewii TaxID=51364 RepID=A0ABY5TVM2_9MOLU|nr:hypothetical protein [Mycoplasma cottewii]UWD34713.1 hypothetical protein NX779_02760 [Mycoplasma cottewii]
MARKGKLLSIIAGLVVISSSAAGVTVGVLHNKRKLDAKTINLGNDIPEDKRSLSILYTEDETKILSQINFLLLLSRKDKQFTQLKNKDVTMEFNKKIPSVKITAKKESKFIKGSVELKFNKPNIDSLIKEESRNLGVFSVRSTEKVVEILVQRDVLNNKDFNAQKIKQNFDIQINEQEKIVKVKAKVDSIFYIGEVDFRYDLPQFSSLENLIKTLDQLENNDQQTVLNRFIELNKALFERENVKITSDQLQVQISANTAKITLTGNKNYQGSITINLSVIPQFSSLENLIKTLDQLENNDQQTVLNRFIELNKALFERENVKITSDQLQVQISANTAKITLTGNKNYQGSVDVSLVVKKQFDTIKNLQKDINQLVDTNQTTVLNRFFELNQQTLKPFNITKDNLKVEVSSNTATVSIQNHADYQGSIDVSLVVKKQFDTIQNLQKDINQLVDTN